MAAIPFPWVSVGGSGERGRGVEGGGAPVGVDGAGMVRLLWWRVQLLVMTGGRPRAWLCLCRCAPMTGGGGGGG